MKAETEGHIKDFHVGKGDINTTHSQFADDTSLFSEFSNSSSYKNFLKVVDSEKMSGQNTNLHRYGFIGVNIIPSLVIAAEEFGCNVDTWPNTYLDFPLNGSPNTLSFWAPITENVERRLSS